MAVSYRPDSLSSASCQSETGMTTSREGQFSRRTVEQAAAIERGRETSGRDIRSTCVSGSQYQLLADLFCQRRHHDFKKIGTGGCATVYKIEGVSDRQSYAVKIAQGGRSISMEAAKCTIEKEITVLKTLAHENIISILYDFDYETVPAFIMPYAETDLLEVLETSMESKTVLQDGDIRALSKALIAGLTYLHSADIVHSDLKPDNILLVQDIWKISDLGFAKKTEGVRNFRYGIPRYWAPEVYKYLRYTKASDRWALGLMLFEASACPYSMPYYKDCGSRGQILSNYYFYGTFLYDLHHTSVGEKQLCVLKIKKTFKKRVKKYCGTIASLYDARGMPIEQFINNLPRLHDRIMAYALTLLRENPAQRLALHHLQGVVDS